MVTLDDDQMLKRINDYVLIELRKYENINEFEITKGIFVKKVEQSKLFTIKISFKYLKENLSFDFYLEYDDEMLSTSLELPKISNAHVGFEILKLYEKFEAIHQKYIFDIISFTKKF